MASPGDDQDERIAAYIETDIKPTNLSGSIYRIPKSLSSKRPLAYRPKNVSIGWLTSLQGDGQKQIKERKQWHLNYFVDNYAVMDLIEIQSVIRNLEDSARKCYSDDSLFTNRDFVTIMVTDGCFMLNIFHLWANNDIHVDESIFKTWLLGAIRRDMILLENQIPFIVLERLFNLTKDVFRENITLNKLILTFFSPLVLTPINSQAFEQIQPKHVLDLLRKALLHPDCSDSSNSPVPQPVPQRTRCISDLLKSGVRFKMKVNSRNLLDVTYRNGVVEIPPFIFRRPTEDLLRNLVVYEQCDKNCSSQITSYVTLLDILVNTSKDVMVLKHEGIITNYLADDAEVASAINKLSSGAVCRQFDYDELCKQVNDYYNKNLNKWRAALKRDYLGSPWKIISIIAALFLLLLTSAQTILAFLSYFRSITP